MAHNRSAKRGLAFKLSLSILSGTALLIFVILFFNYHFSKQLLFDSAGETVEQLTNATGNRIETMINTVEKAPEGMALYLQSNDLDKEIIGGMLAVGLKNKPELFGACVAFEPLTFNTGVEGYAPYCYRTPEGIGFKDLAGESYKYVNQDWYVLARDAGHPVWTEPYFDKGGGNILMATYAVPFYSADSLQHVFRGVVTADLSLSWLENLMDSIKIFDTGYAFLLSEKLTIITHPDKKNQFKNLREFIGKISDPVMLARAIHMLQGGKGFLPFHSEINHKSCLMYFSSLPRTNWQMAIVIPEDELYAGLKRLYIYTFIIGIAGIILLSLVVILFSARITKPLRRLTLTADQIGAGNFDVQIQEDKSTREISMLGNALGRMQRELKEYIRNLEVTTAAKERFESELNIAHDIQQGMIPKIFPPFPNRKDIDIYAILKPARQVGGDLYDFYFLDDDTLCFAIGDVSDKGVPASLLMAITITLFRAKSNIDMTINEMANSMNRDISRDNENMMFVTFFMGILNMRTGELNYCNAGHNYPLLLKNDGALESLAETHGVPFGINEKQVYKAGRVTLEKQDTLVLFTDGVTEAISIEGNFYGDDRFAELIRSKCPGLGPRQISEKIMEDVAEFARTPERSDDITLLVMTYYPADKQ